jgi:hypothetical protein
VVAGGGGSGAFVGAPAAAIVGLGEETVVADAAGVAAAGLAIGLAGCGVAVSAGAVVGCVTTTGLAGAVGLGSTTTGLAPAVGVTSLVCGLAAGEADGTVTTGDASGVDGASATGEAAGEAAGEPATGEPATGLAAGLPVWAGVTEVAGATVTVETATVATGVGVLLSSFLPQAARTTVAASVTAANSAVRRHRRCDRVADGGLRSSVDWS